MHPVATLSGGIAPLEQLKSHELLLYFQLIPFSVSVLLSAGRIRFCLIKVNKTTVSAKQAACLGFRV